MESPVYLVVGEDQALVGEATRTLLARLVGSGDAALLVEEPVFDVDDLSPLVDAARTPAFLADRRIVVARDIGRLTAAQASPLIAYLASPDPTTRLVLVASGPKPTRGLVQAARKAGEMVEAGPPVARDRSAWVAARVSKSAIRLEPVATADLMVHLGEDVSRLDSLLGVLTSAFGPGARLSRADLAPYLGEAGPGAPWDLTDAVDRGDGQAALVALHRLLGGGQRHPLVVLAILHTHLARMLRLDGAGITTEAEAALALGITGSTFRAGKALRQAQRMGSGAIARAVQLLADADLAIKGATEWPPDLVLEVLVARLSRLSTGR
ncbi:MAG: DNA polymerase III subunit delta [Acidimicrobiales bacterium]